MIRNATILDAKEICRIYNYYIQNSFTTFEQTPISEKEMAGRINKTIAKFPFLVSELSNSELSGFAYASEWKQRTAYNFTVESSVYVDHEETEQGVGKKLYNELIFMLKKHGFKQAIASIALPNEASIMLHEHLGYKKAGTFKNVGRKFGKWIDVGFWQLEL